MDLRIFDANRLRGLKWLNGSFIIQFQSLSRRESLTPPGWDINPYQVRQQQTLALKLPGLVKIECQISFGRKVTKNVESLEELTDQTWTLWSDRRDLLEYANHNTNFYHLNDKIPALGFIVSLCYKISFQTRWCWGGYNRWLKRWLLKWNKIRIN